MPVLLLGRGLSGVGGAGITTITRIIISDVRSLDDNAIQSTILVSMQGLGYILGTTTPRTSISLWIESDYWSKGPLIGGGLTSISWRYIFAINIPVAILSIFLLWALLRGRLVGPRGPNHEDRGDNPNQLSIEVSPLTITQKLARVDWIGAVILVSASILVLFGLSAGSTSLATSSWTSPSTLGSLVTGGLVTAAFPACEWLLRANATYHSEQSSRSGQGQSLVQKLRAKWVKYTNGVEPMIPLELFSSPDVWASYFNAMTGGMLLFSCLYFLSTYFIVVVGYNPVRSALQLLLVSPGLGSSVLCISPQCLPRAVNIITRCGLICGDLYDQILASSKSVVWFSTDSLPET